MSENVTSWYYSVTLVNVKFILHSAAIVKIRDSFSAQKVLHQRRCSPSVSHPALLEFDKLLRLGVKRITNSF